MSFFAEEEKTLFFLSLRACRGVVIHAFSQLRDEK